MSIAAPPETSCSTTHFRCKKDFFYKIQYGVVEQRVCIHKSQRRTKREVRYSGAVLFTMLCIIIALLTAR